jgi:lipopolysaccharide/colanic/teichoic acid biosynthesis glycosyltransferase
MLVVLAVPIGIVALAVLASSGGPVFYSQQRVGRNGKPFKMWKFRSMQRGAEDDDGPVWASREDPRRTPVGRFLRRFSLDELPQLLNVLRGDMSLVGPRPERPLFVTRFSGGNTWYRFRHRMRPGMTGLSQVRGLRGDTPIEPRVQWDNWYIEHWSLSLDAEVLVRTLIEVIRGRNAT